MLGILTKKERLLSLVIVAFFSFCLFQQHGRREDWPFSFFGMYSGQTSGDFISRFDLDWIPDEGPPVNLYHRENGYYMIDHFKAIATGQRLDYNNVVLVPEGDLRTDPETIRQLQKSLVQDALPILARRGLDEKKGKIRLRYRRWVDFIPHKRDVPKISAVLVDMTPEQLRTEVER